MCLADLIIERAATNNYVLTLNSNIRRRKPVETERQKQLIFQNVAVWFLL